MVPAKELDGVLQRNRLRWARNRLVRIGMRRAQHLGWPNTYTFTKSLGESVLAARGQGFADCDRAAFHRRKFRALAVFRME